MDYAVAGIIGRNSQRALDDLPLVESQVMGFYIKKGPVRWVLYAGVDYLGPKNFYYDTYQAARAAYKWYVTYGHTE